MKTNTSGTLHTQVHTYDTKNKKYHFVLNGKYYSKKLGLAVDSIRFLKEEDKLSMSEAQSLLSIYKGGKIV